jgi:intracellular multiplication protein IcmL
MQNERAAVSRRLSDPDFQARLVTRLIGLTIAMVVVTCASLAHSFWLQTQPSKTKYFIIDGRNPPRPVVGLDSPVVDDAQLLEWTVRAVLAAYNVNYHDYPVQLNTAGRRFTLNGWNSFAKSYIASGNFEAMKRARMLCTAQAQRSAVIRDASLVRGRLSYSIQFPIVQTCQNTQQSSDTNLMITALVVRTDAEDRPDGLAVDQLVAAAR